MNGVVVGIDPGLTGAIAVLGADGNFISVEDMPALGGFVSGKLLADLLMPFTWDVAVVERVHSMPSQGVASSFTFGRALGVVEGVLGALGVRVLWAPPGTWKRSWGLIGKDKNASRLLALERWPEAADRLKRKKDNGRAEALLIAAWGRTQA